MRVINNRFEYINKESVFDRRTGNKVSIVPSIVILGAQKSATTSLAAYLDRHPEIYMTKPLKESGYFLPFALIKETLLHQGFRVKNKDECIYKYSLQYYNGERYILDASTYYTIAPKQNREIAIDEIKNAQLKQNIKFIYIIRNPYERIISNYQHYIRRPKGKIALLNKAIKRKISFNPFFLKYRKSMILKMVQRLYDRNITKANKSKLKKGLCFEEYLHRNNHPLEASSYASRILEYKKALHSFECEIVFFEDLKNNPQVTMEKLFSFLQLSPLNYSEFEKYNVNRIDKKLPLYKLSSETKSKIRKVIEGEKKLLQENFPNLNFPPKFLEIPDLFKD